MRGDRPGTYPGRSPAPRIFGLHAAWADAPDVCKALADSGPRPVIDGDTRPSPFCHVASTNHGTIGPSTQNGITHEKVNRF